MDYLTRMEKGLAYLDERQPGWFHGVNLGHLDMASTNQCVIAQLYPGGWFSEAVTDLWRASGDSDLVDLDDEEPYQWAREHGFDGFEGHDADALWGEAILKRRNA